VDELGDLSNADEVPDSVCELQQESTQPPRDEAAEAEDVASQRFRTEQRRRPLRQGQRPT
ncbi:hypothetical protein MTO96_031774, partial [Rhipicephalus appendiculatus]